MLRDDDLVAALVDVGDNGAAVEGLVGDQRIERQALKQRRNANRVEALARHEHKTHEVAERVCERQNFGGHAASGFAYGLALSPPFAPCL